MTDAKHLGIGSKVLIQCEISEYSTNQTGFLVSPDGGITTTWISTGDVIDTKDHSIADIRHLFQTKCTSDMTLIKNELPKEEPVEEKSLCHKCSEKFELADLYLCRVCQLEFCTGCIPNVKNYACSDCNQFVSVCINDNCANDCTFRTTHEFLQKIGFVLKMIDLLCRRRIEHNDVFFFRKKQVCVGCFKSGKYILIPACNHYILRPSDVNKCFHCDKTYCRKCLDETTHAIGCTACQARYLLCNECRIQNDYMNLSGCIIVRMRTKKVDDETDDNKTLVSKIDNKNMRTKDEVDIKTNVSKINNSSKLDNENTSIHNTIISTIMRVLVPESVYCCLCSCVQCARVNLKIQFSQCTSCRERICRECLYNGKCVRCLVRECLEEKKCAVCNEWLSKHNNVDNSVECGNCGNKCSDAKLCINGACAKPISIQCFVCSSRVHLNNQIFICKYTQIKYHLYLCCIHNMRRDAIVKTRFTCETCHSTYTPSQFVTCDFSSNVCSEKPMTNTCTECARTSGKWFFYYNKTMNCCVNCRLTLLQLITSYLQGQADKPGLSGIIESYLL